LFEWDKIPGDGDDNDRIINFLYYFLNVKWLEESAKIEKIDDGKTIKISEREHFLFIKLNDKKLKQS
jgi:hypothetical protein